MPSPAVKAFAVVSYVAFLAAFAYYVLFAVGVLGPLVASFGGPWTAVLVDLALIAFFGVTHSVLARAPVKHALGRFVPAAAGRSLFVLIASVQLALICALWQPLPGLIWRVEGLLGVALAAVQAVGWLIALASSFLIDHLALFGLRQGLGLGSGRDRFATPGLYRLVRHPLYFGVLVGLWVTPAMSAGGLLFAAGFTAYVLVGTRLEERDLVRHFGDEYRAYQDRVAMLLPFRRR
jgi:protein-S-isoprenylcysteine O-methyltransferase Ste14